MDNKTTMMDDKTIGNAPVTFLRMLQTCTAQALAISDEVVPGKVTIELLGEYDVKAFPSTLYLSGEDAQVLISIFINDTTIVAAHVAHSNFDSEEMHLAVGRLVTFLQLLNVVMLSSTQTLVDNEA